jgi:polysaccharide pyruvyl transferase WcaK-like protein
LIILLMVGEEYNSRSYLLCSPNNLNTLLSNTLSLCSSLNVRDQVSQPYRTTVKITVLYI